MADGGDQYRTGAQKAPQLPSPTPGQIFVCDASAEAERLMTSLRNRGYPTVDVPLGMLPSRVRYELPALVVCDADAHEALRRVREMQEAAGTRVKLLFVGHDDGALRQESEFRQLATATVTRPLNLAATVDLIESIVGRPAVQKAQRTGPPRRQRAPVLVASARKPYRSDLDGLGDAARAEESPEPEWSVPAPSLSSHFPEAPSGPYVTDTRPSGPPSSVPPSSSDAKLSPETRAVLDEGKRRIAAHPVQPPRPTRIGASADERGTPDPQLLAALRRPLDPEDRSRLAPAEYASEPAPEDVALDSQPLARVSASGAPAFPETQQATAGGGTTVRAQAESDSEGAPAPSSAERSDEGGRGLLRPGPPSTREHPQDAPKTDAHDVPAVGSDHATLAPPMRTRAATHAEDLTNPGGRPATQRPPSDDAAPPPLDDLSDLLSAPAHGTAGSTSSDAPPTISASARTASAYNFRAPMGESRLLERMSGARRPSAVIGQAIRESRSGSLAQEHGGGVRRILLRDGDVLTVTSSRDDEALSNFLRERGDLTDEALSGIGPLPHFGRHAGAALIARGLLRQDDLWPVLRAHAEWLLGRMLLTTAEVVPETEVPARVREEPAVFGGAAGAEVFVEVIQRVIEPNAALHALGGGTRKMGLGANYALLAECALETDLEQRALTATESDLRLILERDPELLPVVLGLLELGVLSAGTGPSAEPPPTGAFRARTQQMDDDAFSGRVAARRALVDEGDYFTVLGVSRSATAHEVDRAHLALHQEFAAENLSPRAGHLRADIELILEIVDEAHLILRDEVRRRRYRLALEDAPLTPRR